MKSWLAILLPLALLPNFLAGQPLNFLVETEDPGQAEEIVAVLTGANTLLSDFGEGNSSSDAPNFAFYLKKNAISNGKISADAIETIKGGVFKALDSVKAPNDDCYIQRFTLFATGEVVVAISSTVDNRDDYMACLSVALQFHLTRDPDFDESVDWRDRILKSVVEFRQHGWK